MEEDDGGYDVRGHVHGYWQIFLCICCIGTAARAVGPLCGVGVRLGCVDLAS